MLIVTRSSLLLPLPLLECPMLPLEELTRTLPLALISVSLPLLEDTCWPPPATPEAPLSATPDDADVHLSVVVSSSRPWRIMGTCSSEGNSVVGGEGPKSPASSSNWLRWGNVTPSPNELKTGKNHRALLSPKIS